MMRKTSFALVACAAVLAGSGVAWNASADEFATHVMNITLPDGSVAQLRYEGDTPPPIVLSPVSRLPTAPLLAFDPFQAMDRIIDAMDREQSAMLRDVEALETTAPEGAVPAGFDRMPQGAAGFVVVATIGEGGGCVRSTTITSSGDGAAPLVRTAARGDCGGAATPDPARHAPVPAAEPAARIRAPLLQVRATPRELHHSLVRQVADWRG